MFEVIENFKRNRIDLRKTILKENQQFIENILTKIDTSNKLLAKDKKLIKVELYDNVNEITNSNLKFMKSTFKIDFNCKSITGIFIEGKFHKAKLYIECKGKKFLIDDIDKDVSNFNDFLDKHSSNPSDSALSNEYNSLNLVKLNFNMIEQKIYKSSELNPLYIEIEKEWWLKNENIVPKLFVETSTFYEQIPIKPFLFREFKDVSKHKNIKITEINNTSIIQFDYHLYTSSLVGIIITNAETSKLMNQKLMIFDIFDIDHKRLFHSIQLYDKIYNKFSSIEQINHINMKNEIGARKIYANKILNGNELLPNSNESKSIFKEKNDSSYNNLFIPIDTLMGYSSFQEAYQFSPPIDLSKSKIYLIYSSILTNIDNEEYYPHYSHPE